jgi:hypothetical protein
MRVFDDGKKEYAISSGDLVSFITFSVLHQLNFSSSLQSLFLAKKILICFGSMPLHGGKWPRAQSVTDDRTLLLLVRYNVAWPTRMTKCMVVYIQ